jgi:hypothetical protein
VQVPNDVLHTEKSTKMNERVDVVFITKQNVNGHVCVKMAFKTHLDQNIAGENAR